jgi:NAD(P)-dependent dehydrogenase (short-subunit alcohol dehydrogenase family)
MNTKGCVAMITGGASGLGEATVRYLVERGAKVSILDIDANRGEKIARELGKDVVFCRTDVTDEGSVQTAIDATMKTFGAIHVNVNCAGIGPAEKVLGKKGVMSIEKFSKVVQLNLIGTINAIRLSAEKMALNTPNEDNEKGVVVNTASTAAFDGQIGQAAYSASKAGVVGMTLPIARELAEHGIRVVTIAPGLFRTPLAETLHPKAIEALESQIPFPKRLGKPSEFAMLVGQIIENPMFNGATLRLDGALRMTAR